MITEAPIWIDLDTAEAIHDRQLSEHGGTGGIRDRAMLDSAMARPRQLVAYGGSDVDIPAIAAAYAFGISKNHPFVDGNKRVAAVVCELFLELNGYLLLADDSTLFPVFLALAAGQLSEDELTEWLRRNCRPERVSEDREQYA